MGNKASKPLQGKVLSFRPATVIGSPKSPIAWLCGYDEPVNGMQAIGSNKTDLAKEYLPKACRG
jgi:type IV pilus assembly protein PilA